MLERNGRGENFLIFSCNGRRMLRSKKKKEDGRAMWLAEGFLFGYCVHIRVVLELSIIYLADIYKSASCGL